MGPVTFRMLVTSDAILRGWGVIHKGRVVNDGWGPHQWGTHINQLELLAAFLVLCHFLPLMRDHQNRQQTFSLTSADKVDYSFIHCTCWLAV